MVERREIVPYRSDIMGLLFEVDVPVVYANETSRGWQINTFPAGFTPRIPARLKPRHVEGFEATSGIRRTAMIADPAADLWTGVATTFNSISGDGVVATCTVTGYIGEAVTTKPNP